MSASVESSRQVASVVEFPADRRDRISALESAHQVGRSAADVVASTDVCRVRIGRLWLSGEDSLAVARRVFDSFHDGTRTLGALDFRQVWKKAHVVVPSTPATDRVLLPHHDGGSSTRLETPAAMGEPEQVERKAYAAFVVIDAGEGAAMTTFYPLVPMVRRAMPHTVPTLSDAYRWFDRNLATFHETKCRHGLEGRYLTIPRMLGAPSSALTAIDRNEGHDDLTAEEIAAFPDLETLRHDCPCGSCAGEGTRIYCRGLTEAMGLTWPRVRAEFEIQVVAQRWDLVLWNNVFLQHAGVGGGANRTLMHSYLVSQGSGEDYARWVSDHWTRHWNATDHREGTP